MKKFKIHPISILIWIWLFLFLGLKSAISYLVAISLHEYAHYFIAKRLGYSLSRFALSPYGAELSYAGQDIDCRDEIKIALAGPCVNLLSSLLIVGVWWVFPATNFFTEDFVFVSMILALFNLLPAYPLDGGRVFVNLFSLFFDKKNARKITVIFNVILSVFFFAMFFICCFSNFNPSLLLFAVFLTVGCLDLFESSKFERMNIFNKKTKNFAKPVVIMVNGQTTIKQLMKFVQTGKTHLFCFVTENGKSVFLSEKFVIKLIENFDLNEKLDNILKK